MKDLLSQLGMGIAFSPSADFTGLSPQACCIGLVQQAIAILQADDGVERGVDRLDARQVSLHHLAAGELPRVNGR